MVDTIVTNPTVGPDTGPLMILVGRMDGKLDMLLTADKEQNARIESLGARVGALEETRAKAGGIWLAVSAIVGAAGDFIITHVWK